MRFGDFFKASLLAVSGFVVAAEPLPDRIDALVEAKAGGPVNPPASDADFLRRVYLDVAGRIPSVEEARRFLGDGAADKRARLIDTLFASPEFPRRMEELLHQMLMERRGEDAEWQKFLTWAADTNQPWDAIARAILDPNADNEQVRGAAYFITNRLTKVGQQDTDYPGLTRDVGRMFMGVDLQCAQCHDHLFIDDYKQVDFQGLHAVYLNTTIRSDVKFPAVTEKVMAKKLDFQSVFDQEPMAVGPRVPLAEEIEIPVFEKGEEYAVPPDPKNKVVGVPKFSPLESLATNLASAENRAFAGNLANRLWYFMMGRGLVHPLDLHHSGNEPSHPEVLALLTDEVVARKFDMKSVLRDLALTKTYQRSSVRPPGETVPEDRYRVAIEKPLWAEQLLWSTLVATGPGTADDDPRKTDRVADLRKKFLVAFANPAKDPEIDFAPSVKAALFVMNDSTILGRLAPANGNLIARLLAMTDESQRVDEVYLAVLGRMPTADERADVAGVLQRHAGDEKQQARTLGLVAWALLSSTEFCLNH
jgi:hypothetical protein